MEISGTFTQKITQKHLHAYTNGFYTEKLLHEEVFNREFVMHKNCYTHKDFYTKVFANIGPNKVDTGKILHRDKPGHKSALRHCKTSSLCQYSSAINSSRGFVAYEISNQLSTFDFHVVQKGCIWDFKAAILLAFLPFDHDFVQKGWIWDFETAILRWFLTFDPHSDLERDNFSSIFYARLYHFMRTQAKNASGISKLQGLHKFTNIWVWCCVFAILRPSFRARKRRWIQHFSAILPERLSQTRIRFKILKQDLGVEGPLNKSGFVETFDDTCLAGRRGACIRAAGVVQKWASIGLWTTVCFQSHLPTLRLNSKCYQRRSFRFRSMRFLVLSLKVVWFGIHAFD